jgi:hypothetical protein
LSPEAPNIEASLGYSRASLGYSRGGNIFPDFGSSARFTNSSYSSATVSMARLVAELPQSYPNYKTVHRRFQTWCRDEVLRRALTDVANELRDRGALNEEQCFIDATFVMAKGGGVEIGATKRGGSAGPPVPARFNNGKSVMAVSDCESRTPTSECLRCGQTMLVAAISSSA